MMLCFRLSERAPSITRLDCKERRKIRMRSDTATLTDGIQVRIRPSDPASPAGERLLALSDKSFAGLYPPESTHLEASADLRRANVTFVGAYAGSEMIGCGAVKVMEDDGRYGEIKRLFVVDGCRGRGVASAIMLHLEGRLRSEGVSIARLETGVKQHGALALYRRLGYVERAPFGAYREDPLSVFMEKRLTAAPAR